MKNSTVGTTGNKPVETEVTKSMKQESLDLNHGKVQQSFKFIFQDTDTIDIPAEMVKHFEVKPESWKWVMKISGAADIPYKPFGVLPPIRKFWSLQNKNLTQLRLPDGRFAVDTYDDDDFDYDNIPQTTREVKNDLVIGVPERRERMRC